MAAERMALDLADDRALALPIELDLHQAGPSSSSEEGVEGLGLDLDGKRFGVLPVDDRGQVPGSAELSVALASRRAWLGDDLQVHGLRVFLCVARVCPSGCWARCERGWYQRAKIVSPGRLPIIGGPWRPRS